MSKTFIIGEIGINANGSLEIAKELIRKAHSAGADAVKFQKRTIELVYTKEELDKQRESPFGTTNRQQKEGLEFSKEDYDQIDAFCKEIGMEWFASAWDLESQQFLKRFDLKYNKVASAMLSDLELLKMIASEKRHTFISTGMSTLEEIDVAVEIFDKAKCSFELMHCNSTYPMKNEDANLNVIHTLRGRYDCKVGYSGHESGRIVSIAAVAMGATSLERHITLDRTMYGSDQAASIEMDEFKRLVDDVRTVENSMGSYEKTILPTEVPIREKLKKK
jgi:N-acetylneuraminate synthase